MFFTSYPNSTIRVVNSEFCMPFIKPPQAGKKLSLAAPQWVRGKENGSPSVPARGWTSRLPLHSLESVASQAPSLGDISLNQHQRS